MICKPSPLRARIRSRFPLSVTLPALAALLAWPAGHAVAAPPAEPEPAASAPSEAKPPASATPFPGADGKSWPAFRGTGDSRSTAADLPTEWSADKGIAWSRDLPGKGQSSPVVHAGRVFVTAVEGADKETLHVVCVSLADGKVLWDKTSPASRRVKETEYVSKAAPTPCVDADGVVALFESGDLLAFDHDGKPRWSRKLCDDHGDFTNNHGLGSSPAQSADAVFVLAAQGEKSWLLAVSKKTGRDVWKVARPFEASWTSPTCVVRGGRTLVVLSSNGELTAFDAADGKEVWTVRGLKGNTVAGTALSPEGDLLVAGSSEPAGSLAVRLDAGGMATGEGDARVAWRPEGASCSFGSPLVHAGLAWFVNRAGVAVCVDAATGKERWTARLGASCWASPVGAGDRVWFFTSAGTTEVYRATGEKAERLALNESPGGGKDRILGVAAVDGAFVLRRERSLVCVGKPRGRE